MEINLPEILWDVIKDLWWIWTLFGVYALVALFQMWRKYDRRNANNF